MATIVAGQKTAFIALVNAAPFPGGPAEATTLASILNDYSDIPTAIGRQQNLYAANDSYLVECMSVFVPNDTDLVAAGIYFNKPNIVLSISDPVLIVKCGVNAGIIITNNQQGLALLAGTTVNSITVNASIDLQNLYIGPGCTVDVYNGSATSAQVNNIWLPYLKSRPSALNVVKVGSIIGAVRVSDGSYYGGIQNIDPEATCAAGPVTGLSANDITHDSMVVTWTPPASGFMFIDVYFKETESSVWVTATSDDGDFIQQAGFAFRSLKSDTYYDFRVRVTCNNGGIADATISAQTICCGSGGEVLVGDCLVSVHIKTSPDPTKKFILCNGVEIALEYGEGATLTIPELAGRRLASDVIISNIPYQDIPFNRALFQFDLSTTPLVEFQDPNIVSFEVRLPL